MDRNKLVPAVKRSRASRPKVKTGCTTCKVRGVKCDEEKPACRRCISSGRVCNGYGIWGGGGNTYGSKDRAARLSSSRPLPIWPLQFLGRKVGLQEEMAFDFFKTRTAIKLPGAFESGFWDTLVFQASSKEPAVLHALISLGAVDLSRADPENEKYPNDTSRISLYESLALQQYNKAIGYLAAHFESRSEDSLRVALITCMVFICIELLRGEFNTANTHLSHGLNLLCEIQGRQWSSPAIKSLMLRPEPGSVDDYLIEAFTRLNIHSALFGQGMSLLYVVSQNATCGPYYEIPQAFETFRTARLYLDGLMNGVYYLSVQIDEFFHAHHHVPEKLVRRKERLQASLELWLQTFDVYLLSLAGQGNHRMAVGIPILRIYYVMATIMVSVCIRPSDEMVYDLHTLDFASIIRQAARLWDMVSNMDPSFQEDNVLELGFTIDMGFIPPLYYTALKCRDPGIRRKAIDLLLSAPHREGLWDGVMAAYVARHVMQIEEGSIYKNFGAQDGPGLSNAPASIVPDNTPVIPHSTRVYNVSIRLPDGISRNTGLIYSQCGSGDDLCEPRTTEIDLTLHRISSGSLGGCSLNLLRSTCGK